MTLQFISHPFKPQGIRLSSFHLDQLYREWEKKNDPVERYLFCYQLLLSEPELFFAFADTYLNEILPIIYTPTVGKICQNYSHLIFSHQGLFIDSDNLIYLEEELRKRPDIKIAVVTDGERILGLGDLGIGGMGISLGKSLLYTLFGGLPHSSVLPIVLDVGTDRESLQKDEKYIGRRHPRLKGEEYDIFIEKFVAIFRKVYPTALLQWEDFSKINARKLLLRYQQKLLSFNDDIQGTAAVTVAVILAALQKKGSSLEGERILFYGAGSANLGTAELLISYLESKGIAKEEAQKRIFMVDSKGLVTVDRKDLSEELKPFASDLAPSCSLEEICQQLHPTILIGASTQGGAFTPSLLSQLCQWSEQPIVLALSNPTDKAECSLQEAIEATKGRVIFASGSPFPPFFYNGKEYFTTQANNLYIFPAIGLAATLSSLPSIPNSLFLEAAIALSEFSSDRTLLPPLSALPKEIVPYLAKRIIKKSALMGLIQEEKANELCLQIES